MIVDGMREARPYYLGHFPECPNTEVLSAFLILAVVASDIDLCSLTFRAENVPAGISAVSHPVGMESSLANLARLM